MKIKNGFVKREVAGSHIVVSVDPANGFNGMIKLNETSNFLWDKLTLGATREELIASLLDEYEVSEADAANGVDIFLADVKRAGCVEE